MTRQLLPQIRTALIAAAVVVSAWCHGFAWAQDFRAQVVGGKFANLPESHVALILTSDGQCSGILVGPREVLTAAHCITSEVDDYRVLVGGQWYYAAAAWYHASYNHDGNATLNAPFDLGMIELSRSVTGAKPLPILTDLPVSVGDNLDFAGYGSTETSGLPGVQPWENARVGELIVTEKEYGVFSSEHATGGASACSGDSGGPAVRSLGPHFGLVGVLSVGSNRVILGNCYVVYGGSFTYVDLASAPSRQFLSNFPGVRYLSAKRVAVDLAARKFGKDLSKALKAKNIATFKKSVSTIRRGLARFVKYSSGRHKTLLTGAIAKLKVAGKVTSLNAGRKAGRAAAVNLKALVRLGVL